MVVLRVLAYHSCEIPVKAAPNECRTSTDATEVREGIDIPEAGRVHPEFPSALTDERNEPNIAHARALAVAGELKIIIVECYLPLARKPAENHVLPAGDTLWRPSYWREELGTNPAALDNPS